MSCINSVSIAECAVPLPRPVRLGRSEIRTRNFLALRIGAQDGAAGEAIGYVRGSPLFGALETLAPHLLGADSLMRGEILSELEWSNVPGRAAFTRATSLLDIALWDLAAKRAELPLFQLIGGFARAAHASAVAGYYMHERSVEDITSEVSDRFNQGYGRVKVMLNGGDARFDQRLVEALSALSGRVAADAHWSWSTLTEARRYCRRLDSMGLDFLEDPFSAADWRLTHELQQTIDTPLAAGEDVCGAAQMDQLVKGIGLLRLDATTCGGITGAIEAIGIAAAAGRAVLPHVFAPLHVHLACAFANVEGVEVVPADVAADPLDRLLMENPVVASGAMQPSTQPGVGLLLNWKAIERFAVQTRTFSTA
jgi:L-alanine-DL-glutamate epimerase-like enolase superfamily enzyme